MKAVIYARVYTGEQKTGNQMAQLTAWATPRGWMVTITYKESESAWENGHQRELARLLSDAKKRKFNTVLVWRSIVCREKVPSQS